MTESNIEPGAFDGDPARIFTWRDGDVVYPFFQDEDGSYFGLGHQDPVEFATAIRAFDERVVGTPPARLDEVDELVAHVEHVYFATDVPRCSEDYYAVQQVASDAEGAYAVTRVLA